MERLERRISRAERQMQGEDDEIVTFDVGTGESWQMTMGQFRQIFRELNGTRHLPAILRESAHRCMICGLQWGRATNSAETETEDGEAVRRVALQWGRATNSAETPGGRGRFGAGQGASMGPRYE